MIIILTDDQGYADVGFNGCTDIPTPNIDRIAAEGVRCTNGYVTFAVCGPSRAGLITGRYQDRFGACRNPTIDPAVPNNGVPTSEKNIAELLKPIGYTSMAVGKWHLGTFPSLRPLERGFDEFFGFLSGGHQYFPEMLTLNDLSEVTYEFEWYNTKLLRNEARVDIHDYLTDELSDAGVDFIERNSDSPFFLYMAYNAPHTPLQATKKYLDRFPHIQNKKRKTYAAMVSAVDDGVGRILDKLSKLDLDENTIVFFLSDNGGPPENGSRNKPLRGHKGSPFEGGVRVPFAVRWTGTIPAGIDYDQPVSSLDIAATIVAHADASVPVDKPLDGVDLIPYLTEKRIESPHQTLYWRWFDKNIYSVRNGFSKLILVEGEIINDKYEPQMLFDLKADLSEKNNIFQNRPQTVADASGKLDVWKKELVPPNAPGLGSWMPKKQSDK
ncbi:sulfatase-like hydrolase/transferase [Bythopirellula polymerisocia]|uniref:sulfatase-like hydrolase/transferase n=1 Tax=Bythopirellula polymerisocia TaxID=2528003 RepID=UPI0018D28BBE|nr:sulfatase-like hydrolase/transferase [Bythopirellula polymerisocia]